MSMTKRYFAISWPEDLGEMWMNIDNLRALMFSRGMIPGNLGVEVEDVTDQSWAFQPFPCASCGKTVPPTNQGDAAICHECAEKME